MANSGEAKNIEAAKDLAPQVNSVRRLSKSSLQAATCQKRLQFGRCREFCSSNFSPVLIMLLGSQAYVANKVRCLARAKGRQKYDKRGGLAIEEGLFGQRDWQKGAGTGKLEIPPTLSYPASPSLLWATSPPSTKTSDLRLSSMTKTGMELVETNQKCWTQV